MVQRGIGVERNRPIAAFIFKGGCERMRERDQSRLSVARFDELRSLRNVFSQYKPAGNLIVNSKVPQRGLGCAPVRGSRGICDRNLLDRRVEQSFHSELR